MLKMLHKKDEVVADAFSQNLIMFCFSGCAKKKVSKHFGFTVNLMKKKVNEVTHEESMSD